VRQSGKNSADIRMVVDALDLCYTKSHVNTFVIISGDSDFSPLVSKLRENAKQVIGVGVKQSTSDLLVANCDEFIFYDDLVRESRRTSARHDTRDVQPAAKRPTAEDSGRKEELELRRTQAIDMVVETFDALASARGDSSKIWASRIKQAIRRRKPDFNESHYGFRTFGNLLEETQSRGLLQVGRDEKSGSYAYRSTSGAPGATAAAENHDATAVPHVSVPETETAAESAPPAKSRGRSGTGRKPVKNTSALPEAIASQEEVAPLESAAKPSKKSTPRTRRPRKKTVTTAGE
jgi:hypothetical protein